MRTTIDLPDALFRDLKVAAAHRGVPLKVLIRSAVEAELQRGQKKAAKRVKFPVLPSREPGTLNLSNAEIEDLLA